MVFNERLINMPVQTAPPMFKMLLEEIQWACEDVRPALPEHIICPLTLAGLCNPRWLAAQGAPYAFDYLMLILKTYRETAEVDTTADRPRPGARSGGAPPAKKVAAVAPAKDQLFYFNEEEEYIHQIATFEVEYRPTDAQADVRQTFANIHIKPWRQLVLVPFGRLAGAVERMERDIAAAAAKAAKA